MDFTELELHPKVVEGLQKVGFKTCTPVQEVCIPLVLAGKDVAGLAQTGTGKTGAFLVPLLDRLYRSKANEEPEVRRFTEYNPSNFILILVPTRELADQISANVESLGAPGGIRYVTIYGGTGYEKQRAALKQGVDFVIATPGRLIDLYKEHLVDLRLVRALVFDEADRMFDMGFKDDMQYILTRVPKDRQFLVFSATLNFDVLNTAYKFGAEPIEININRDQAKAENVKDNIIHLGEDEKPSALLSLFKKHNPTQVIVFSNYKSKVERIAQFLSQNGYPATAISSLQSQAQRTQVIGDFKAQSKGSILVATDLAARGLDVTGVDLVVNFELPDDPETYVHRIGRTGRAGEAGKAISLVSDRDVYALTRIEEFLKIKLDTDWIDDSEWVKDFKPFPRDQGRFFKPRQVTPFSAGGRQQSSGGRGPRRHSSEGGGSSGGPRRHASSGGGPSRQSDRPQRQGDDQRSQRQGDGQRPQRGGDNRGYRNGAADQQPRREQGAQGQSAHGQGHGQARNHRQEHPHAAARKSGGATPAHRIDQQIKRSTQSTPNTAGAKAKKGGRYRVVDKPAKAPSVTGAVTGFLKKLLGLKKSESSVVVSRGRHADFKKPTPRK